MSVAPVVIVKMEGGWSASMSIEETGEVVFDVNGMKLDPVAAHAMAMVLLDWIPTTLTPTMREHYARERDFAKAVLDAALEAMITPGSAPESGTPVGTP